MDPARSAAIAVEAQWLRCAHVGTALVADDRTVTLAWEKPAVTPGVTPPPGGGPKPAGLAFGPGHAAYHAVPEEGRIVRTRWAPGGLLAPGRAGARHRAAPAEDLLETGSVPGPPTGTFAPAPGAPRRCVRAVAMAVDPDGRLIVLDGTDGSVSVLDPAARRLVRRVASGVPGTPVDLAGHSGGPLIACREPDAALWQAGPVGPPRPFPAPAGPRAALPPGTVPARVAVGPGDEVWLLRRGPAGEGWAVPVADPRTRHPLGPFPGATDLELDGAAAVVVAGPAGADLRRFTFGDGGSAEERPLRAPRYDGRGLARTPDGRIGYWGGTGPRTAFGAPVRYRTAGRVDTFALDSGVYRQRWGRLFVDACLPPGTSLSVGFLTSDDLPADVGGEPLPHTLPANVDPDSVALPPGPPLAPADEAERLYGRDTATGAGGLYRRGAPEVPWARRAAGDPFVTYESPVHAPPGRYLWLRLHLTGTSKTAPRIRALRVEGTGHRLLERLPGVYSAEPRAAAFLDRFLALATGVLTDLDARAAGRELVLDPAAAPPEFLPWLASLVGLTLDERWPEPARRTLLAEAVELFRSRGTPAGLSRMLAIYLGAEPVLVERFRFRGLGDARGPQFVAPGGAFADYAHRFSVVVPGTLSDEQRACVRHILDLHRPAHTLAEVCTADGGARLGVGCHLELTSVIGSSSGFRRLAVGGVLGGHAVLGEPAGGLTVGGSRVGGNPEARP
ncbi:phage tail protein [Streptomyces sp. NPDC046215]|uniref:phage tail protein n=1 Tax=Streptomyces sp. NPDC046215 TaxID=3155774 RepID=UPI003405D11E